MLSVDGDADAAVEARVCKGWNKFRQLVPLLNNKDVSLLMTEKLYTMSQKNVPPLACYNFDTHEWILIFFGRNVTDKVGNQKTLYYATSNNLCFCTTWQNGET